MNLIVEPAVFFISQDEWKDESNKQAFIDQFETLFEALKEYGFIQPCWTDGMDEAIWGNWDLIPWWHDRAYKQRVGEILIRFLSDRVVHFDECRCEGGQLSREIEQFNHTIQSAFQSLIHSAMGQGDNALIFPAHYHCLQTESLDFACRNHGNITFQTMDSDGIWLKDFLTSDDLWPLTGDLTTISLFKTAIKTRAALNRLSIVYQDYIFEPQFIEAISAERVRPFRKKILEALALRLSMNQNSAVNNHSLKDEGIRRYNNRIRRFRVDQQQRIHYIYSETGSIAFQMYYSEYEEL